MKKIDITERSEGKIAFYKQKGRGIQIEVQFINETVWLSQKQMAELFGKNVRTINEHIGNIFKEGELLRRSVIRNFRITAVDGKQYLTAFYNLDVIISVGYRVKSLNGTRFRIWATGVLKKHLVDGYSINQKLLKAKEEKFLAFQRAIKLIETVKARKPLEYKEAMGLLNLINKEN